MQTLDLHPQVSQSFYDVFDSMKFDNMNIDWVLNDMEQAGDLINDVSNKMIDAIMSFLARLPFGDKIKQFFGHMCMKICELIDSFEQVDGDEIAEGIAIVLKASSHYMMFLVRDEMYLFSGIAYGIAEFFDRIGEHTPQKVTTLLDKISNGI